MCLCECVNACSACCRQSVIIKAAYARLTTLSIHKHKGGSGGSSNGGDTGRAADEQLSCRELSMAARPIGVNLHWQSKEQGVRVRENLTKSEYPLGCFNRDTKRYFRKLLSDLHNYVDYKCPVLTEFLKILNRAVKGVKCVSL